MLKEQKTKNLNHQMKMKLKKTTKHNENTDSDIYVEQLKGFVQTNKNV